MNEEDHKAWELLATVGEEVGADFEVTSYARGSVSDEARIVTARITRGESTVRGQGRSIAAAIADIVGQVTRADRLETDIAEALRARSPS